MKRVAVSEGVEADFAMKMANDGLLNEGILKDDILYISDTEERVDGKIYCASLKSQIFLGKLYSFPDRVEFRTANPDYNSIIVQGEEQEKLMILGMVTGFFRKVGEGA